MTTRAKIWLGLAGFLLVALVVLSVIWPYDATEISLSDRFLPPVFFDGGSWSHPLGTDQLGRDGVARLLAGGRVSIGTGLSVVVLAGMLGTMIGVLAGQRPGWLEAFLMRATEAAFAFPGLLLAVVVLAALGPRQLTIIVVLTALGWMGFARIAHDHTVEIRERPFVKAAEGLGMSSRRVLLRHVLPNERDALLTVAVLEFAGVVLAEASLSYLGMGIQPPQSSWGLMVAEGQQFLANAWWLVTVPGAVIAFTVIIVNQASRELRPAADRRREREAAQSWVSHRTDRVEQRPAAPGPRSSSDVVLELSDLVVEYRGDSGEHRVLDGIDLTLRRGRCLGVVGESGSGKSTLALAMLGLLPPAGHVVSGSVTWGAVAGSTGLGRTAMVFQDPIKTLNPLMPVGRQVAEGLVRVRGLSRAAAYQRTIELFGHVGLEPARECFPKLPHELSGGMCQRVVIAMAIALEPDVLVADEPTSALDVTIQAQILDLLHDLQTELAMSMLLITHDFGVVASICDDVVVLEKGLVVERGPVDDVLHAPQHPYTRSLLACVPRLDGQAAHRLLTIEEQVDAG